MIVKLSYDAKYDGHMGLYHEHERAKAGANFGGKGWGGELGEVSLGNG